MAFKVMGISVLIIFHNRHEPEHSGAGACFSSSCWSSVATFDLSELL